MNDVENTALHFRGQSSATSDESWISATAPKSHPDWNRGGNYRSLSADDLPYDADMLGIDVSRIREMQDESLDVIVPLLRGETVTAKTDWFTLKEARLNFRPYSEKLDLAFASIASPAGPMQATLIFSSSPSSRLIRRVNMST